MLGLQSVLESKSNSGFSRRGSKDADEQIVLFLFMSTSGPLIQARSQLSSQLHSSGFPERSTDVREGPISLKVLWLSLVNLFSDNKSVVILLLFKNRFISRYVKRLLWRSMFVICPKILNMSIGSCFILFPLKFSTRRNFNASKANGLRNEMWQSSKLRFCRADSGLNDK